MHYMHGLGYMLTYYETQNYKTLFISDYASGPRTAIDRVCVCLCAGNVFELNDI